MLDGLFWRTVLAKPTFGKNGELQWLILEKHRITGTTRTAHPIHPEIRAEDFRMMSRGDSNE